MLATYIINGKNTTIHYKLRMKGIYNLMKAYYLGIPGRIYKKIHMIKLTLVSKIREFRYRKILTKLENTNATRRLIICKGFLCSNCRGYKICSYW